MQREPTLIIMAALAALVLGAVAALIFGHLEAGAQAALVGALVGALGAAAASIRALVTPVAAPDLNAIALKAEKKAASVPPLAALLALALIVGCSGVTAQQAGQAIVIGGVVCEAVVQVADPAVAPLCATAQEIASAVAALLEDAKTAKTAPALTPELLRAKILQQRAQGKVS